MDIWSILRRGLVGRLLQAVAVMVVVLAVAEPSEAQRKHKVDPESASAKACWKAVREKAGDDHPHAKQVHVNLETALEWQENEAEMSIAGQGRVQSRSDSWREFRYRCIYYARTGTVTSVEISMNPDEDWREESGDFGVTLYRDPAFRGHFETFTEDRRDLRGSRIGDDQTTSVRVSRGCSARLFQDLDYRGAYAEITADNGDLRSSRVGDDSVTSIQVRCDGEGWDDDSSSSGGDDWSSDPWNKGITLYRDLNYHGTSETFSSDNPDLRETRIGDDQATSVKVSRGCRARLYRDTNYRGSFTEVSSDVADLRRSQVGDDSITSIQVRCDG
jgi:hypothetical protein